MKIYSIDNSVLLDAKVTSSAVHEEEMMRSNFVRLSWKSNVKVSLGVGTYIIPYGDGVRYRLTEPYWPTQESEDTFTYQPEFQHPIMWLGKVPFTYATKNTLGEDVVQQEWEYTGLTLNILKYAVDFINTTFGFSDREKFALTPIGNIDTSVSLSFSSTDVLSALSAIASGCTENRCEWHLSWAHKALYFGQVSVNLGESVPTLKVGGNVGKASVSQAKDGYYNVFYPQGSTRNMSARAASGENVSTGIRLGLDKAKYPNGEIDTRANANEPRQTLAMAFDEVYPHVDCYVYNVRKRTRYLLDDENKKVVSEYNSDGSVKSYKTYTVWYMRLAYPLTKQIGGKTPIATTREKLNGSPQTLYWYDYEVDDKQILDGYTLCGSFSANTNEGALGSTLVGQPGNGDGFELKYHKAAETIPANEATGDSGVGILKGDYEIVFANQNDTIIPTNESEGLIPRGGETPSVKGNIVILYNIAMGDGEVTAAQDELERRTLAEIAYRHSDRNNYTFTAYPGVFAKDNPHLYVGQRVVYDDGNGYSYTTRVLKLATNLDYDFCQEITVGNAEIKGTVSQLKEDVRGLVSGTIPVGGGLSYEQVVEAIRNYTHTRFLSKRADDSARGLITLLKGLKLGGGPYGLTEGGAARLASAVAGAFETAGYTGAGMHAQGASAYGRDGLGYMVTDYLTVRIKAIFSELEIRKLSYVGGNYIFSHAGGTIISRQELEGLTDKDGHAAAVQPVEEVRDAGGSVTAYKCRFKADDGETRTQGGWQAGDMALCQTFGVKSPGTYRNASNRYYWRLVVDASEETWYRPGKAAGAAPEPRVVSVVTLSNQATLSGGLRASDGSVYYAVGWDGKDARTSIWRGCDARDRQNTDDASAAGRKTYEPWRTASATEAKKEGVADTGGLALSLDAPREGDALVQAGCQADFRQPAGGKAEGGLCHRRGGMVEILTEGVGGEPCPAINVYSSVNDYYWQRFKTIQISADGVSGRAKHFQLLTDSGAGDPVAWFNFRGAWDPAASYAYYDVATHGGSSYVWSDPGRGSTPGTPPPGERGWEVMASAGADGTSFRVRGTAAGHAASRDGVGPAPGLWLIDDPAEPTREVTGRPSPSSPPATAVGDAYVLGGDIWSWDGGAWNDLGAFTGPKGDDAVRLDLDNEMASVPCDHDGAVTDGTTVTARATLYVGARPAAGGVSFTAGRLGGREATVSVSGGAATVSWTFPRGHRPLAGTAAVTATLGGVAYRASVTLTLSRSGAPGESPTVYQVRPSLTAIPFSRDGGGNLTPAAYRLTCGYSATRGGVTTDHPGDTPANLCKEGGAPYNILYRHVGADGAPGAWAWVRDLGAAAGYALTVPSSTPHAAVEFVLTSADGASSVTAASVVDRETVPIVKSGERGADGAAAGRNLLLGAGAYLEASKYEASGSAADNAVFPGVWSVELDGSGGPHSFQVRTDAPLAAAHPGARGSVSAWLYFHRRYEDVRNGTVEALPGGGLAAVNLLAANRSHTVTADGAHAWSFDIPAGYAGVEVRLNTYSDGSAPVSARFWNMKLERGGLATAFSLNEGDLRGGSGRGVSGVDALYSLDAGGGAPAAPKSADYAGEGGNTWNTDPSVFVRPSYAARSLWQCARTLYDDGAATYTTPQKVGDIRDMATVTELYASAAEGEAPAAPPSAADPSARRRGRWAELHSYAPAKGRWTWVCSEIVWLSGAYRVTYTAPARASYSGLDGDPGAGAVALECQPQGVSLTEGYRVSGGEVTVTGYDTGSVALRLTEGGADVTAGATGWAATPPAGVSATVATAADGHAGLAVSVRDKRAAEGVAARDRYVTVSCAYKGLARQARVAVALNPMGTRTATAYGDMAEAVSRKTTEAVNGYGAVTRKEMESAISQSAEEITSTVRKTDDRQDREISSIRQTADSISMKVGAEAAYNLVSGGMLLRRTVTGTDSLLPPGGLEIPGTAGGRAYTVTYRAFVDPSTGGGSKNAAGDLTDAERTAVSGNGIQLGLNWFARAADGTLTWKRYQQLDWSAESRPTVRSATFTCDGEWPVCVLGLYVRGEDGSRPASLKGSYSVDWVRADLGDVTAAEWIPSRNDVAAANLIPDAGLLGAFSAQDYGAGGSRNVIDNDGRLRASRDDREWEQGSDPLSDGAWRYAGFRRGRLSATDPDCYDGFQWFVPFPGAGRYTLSCFFRGLSPSPALDGQVVLEARPCSARSSSARLGGAGVAVTFGRSDAATQLGWARREATLDIPASYGGVAVGWLEVRLYMTRNGHAAASRPCLARAGRAVEWDARALCEARGLTEGMLLGTGIDIRNRRIELTAGATVFRTDTGEAVAVFDRGGINADLITARRLSTADTGEGHVEIEAGVLDVFNPNGRRNIRLGYKGGFMCLTFYDNQGRELYDLGPGGIDTSRLAMATLTPLFARAWASVRRSLQGSGPSWPTDAPGLWDAQTHVMKPAYSPYFFYRGNMPRSGETATLPYGGGDVARYAAGSVGAGGNHTADAARWLSGAGAGAANGLYFALGDGEDADTAHLGASEGADAPDASRLASGWYIGSEASVGRQGGTERWMVMAYRFAGGAMAESFAVYSYEPYDKG